MLVSWLEQNVSWALGIGTACFVVATLAFVAGTPSYRVQMPTGSPLKDIVRVFVAAVRKRSLRMERDNVPLKFEDLQHDKNGGIDGKPKR